MQQRLDKAIASQGKLSRSDVHELIKKGYEITAIASFCGFGDFSSFSRSYKQVMGMSPSEYKKLYVKKS